MTSRADSGKAFSSTKGTLKTKKMNKFNLHLLWGKFSSKCVTSPEHLHARDGAFGHAGEHLEKVRMRLLG